MKRHLSISKQTIVAVSLLATVFIAPVASAQTPHDLFQQALRLETSQGDLESAIKLYQQILEVAGSDRDLSATALLRMGQAYETLGLTGATNAYRLIVRDYSDQTDTAKLAQQRLDSMVDMDTSTSGRSTRRIAEELTIDFTEAAFSDDGRYFVNIDWNDASLGYQEVGKKEITYIMPEYELSNSTPNGGRFSPDNRYIAYSTVDSLGISPLKVFDTERKTTRVVIENEGFLEVYDWTEDGSAVLVGISRSGDQSGLALIDIGSGEIQRFHPTENEFAWTACLLNDRYVLFEERSIAGKEIRRLDLMSDTEENFLPETSGKILGGCSNEKQAVVVQTDLFGDSQAWLYRVSDGRPSGEPVSIGEIGPHDLVIGLSDTGDIYYSNSEAGVTTKLYPYSDESGTITGRGDTLPDAFSYLQPAKYMMFKRMPGWTPDGTKLAYRVGWSTLWIREVDRIDRTVELDEFAQSLMWSADGLKILSALGNQGGTASIRFDPESGAVIDSTIGIYGSPGFSGDTFLDVRREDEQTMCVYEYKSGVTTPVQLGCYEDGRSDRAYTWSSGFKSAPSDILVLSDTRELLVPSHDGPNVLQTLVNVDTGSARIVLEGPGWWTKTELLPDRSGFLALSKKGEFFRVPFDGGQPHPQFVSFTDVNDIQYFALHPSENKILITSAQRKQETSESRDLQLISGVWSRLAELP